MLWFILALIAIGGIAILLLVYQLLRMSFRYQAMKNQLHLAEQQYEQERKEKNKLSADLADTQTRLDYTSTVDPLTNLPSRQVLEDRLMQTINQSKRYELIFAVIALNIEELETIENILGAEVKDALLKEIVMRLKSCIRTVDTLSRFPDDKFVFILPQLSKAEAISYVAQRIMDIISEPFLIQNHELYVTTCFGISIYPMDGVDGQVLLKNADTALQQAKARGGNVFQFYRSEMQASSRRELMLNSHLRSNKIYHEFALHYQPIINVETKKIISMEALLRWMHPDFGLISPLEFLQLAENNGRIIAIGEWVLLNACQQFKKWEETGFHPNNISVNVSLRQLENPQFVHRVSQILQDTKMQPGDLVLEISEGVLFPKLEMVEKTLLMLRHLGVQIAIDDFGTGYLSLQHLRRFPVDYLKIDGTLVRDISTDKESEHIVKMIIALAHSLQLTAVAESVESPNQRKLLEELGCSVMQGHLFCVAMAATAFDSAMLVTIHSQV
ncbi:MAG: EAL domain-containing protein [Gammaproteobacteria bacterium]|nr:EAL domain-containing protein [Gammaproteobacteria bacterium]